MPDSFRTHVLDITTGATESVTDLTADCAEFLARAAHGRDGLLNIFVPHATAGIAVLETGAGSDDDLLATLHTLLPADDRWQPGPRPRPRTARSRTAARHVAGDRGAAGAGDMAVGLPG